MKMTHGWTPTSRRQPPFPPPRDALEGKGPQRRPQEQLSRRLEAVAGAVVGGYCQLQMSLSLALGVSETVAGHRLGALESNGRFQSTECPRHRHFQPLVQ